MWLDTSFDVLEAFKNGFPISIMMILPILMAVSPINGAQTFPAYRVNHFDLGGSSYGSRSTYVNMEARSIDSAMLARRCIVTTLSELTLSRYRTIIEKNAGALVVILPYEFKNLSADVLEEYIALEKVFLTEETQIPVYFVIEDDDVKEIYNQVKMSSNTDNSPTATDAMLAAISANGFQLTVSTAAARPLANYKTLNIHGVLEGSGNVDRLPTIVFVAHYDSMAAIPSLAQGADSNGSGVAALIELMRIFSRMYASPSSRADFNIVFLLSGAGKLNYFGTKKWLEEMKDSSRFPYLNDVDLVVCLDNLGKAGPLNVHVSKPPKEGTAGAQILQNLKEVAASKNTEVNMVHKKIYLGSAQLAWEHEQFAMNKMAGMTLSSLNSHKDHMRASALDARQTVDSYTLSVNTYVIGEAVARYVFGIDDSSKSSAGIEILTNDLAVQKSMLDAWLDLLTSESRAAQLLNAKHSIVSSMEQSFQRHLKSVEVTAFTCDTRDPEFVLYDSNAALLNVYSVKPAFFDLILAIAIAAYLGVVYLLSLGFPQFLSVFLNKQKKL